MSFQTNELLVLLHWRVLVCVSFIRKYSLPFAACFFFFVYFFNYFLNEIQLIFSGEGFEESKEALHRIGAPLSFNPGKNGSLAFIGYTDPEKVFSSFIFDYKNIDSNGNSISSSLCQVSWLQEDHKRRGEGPSVINEFILTPAAVEEDESSNVYEENKYERVVLDQPVKQSASVRYSYFSFFLLMTNMFKNLTKNFSFCSR